MFAIRGMRGLYAIQRRTSALRPRASTAGLVPTKSDFMYVPVLLVPVARDAKTIRTIVSRILAITEPASTELTGTIATATPDTQVITAKLR